MSMTIDDLSIDIGDEVYYTAGFHDFFMSYYLYFTDPANGLLSTVQIEPGVALRYTGDFISLLNYLNIPPEYQWCVMVLNNLKSPSEMNMNILTLNIPDLNEIEVLKNLYESNQVT